MAWSDWGDLIGAGVQLWSAKEASDASKKAGNQSAAGAQQAIDLSRDIYNDQRSLNMGAYNDGNAARAQYMRMLGLTPSAPTAGSAGGVGMPRQAPTQWFGEGKDPVVNQQLYGSDPTYRQAWDEVAAFHRSHGSTNYKGGSKDALQSHLSELYTKYQPQQAAQTPAAQPQAPADLADIYDQWRQTPGYQFGLDEGNKQVQSSAAARGGLNSGATLKALQRYGTDYADQQGYRPYMNSLAGLFGGAQQATSNIGSAGANYGQQAGNATKNAANARAQSTYDSANAWQQGVEGAWKYGNQYAQNKGWFG